MTVVLTQPQPLIRYVGPGGDLNVTGVELLTRLHDALKEVQTSVAPVDAGLGAGGMWFVGVQVFDSSGSDTYTPSSGVTHALVKMVGGGGGGGGCDSDTSGTQVGAGGGGASGGFIEALLDVSATSFSATLNIGAGGAGGSGDASGASGGDTTWSDGTNSYTAKGGGGGNRRVDTTANRPVVGGTPGANSASGTTPSINAAGAGGHPGLVDPGDYGLGGNGAASFFGGGGIGGNIGAADSGEGGANGTSRGSGGGGAASRGTTANQDGGDGADGLIIVYEYTTGA